MDAEKTHHLPDSIGSLIIRPEVSLDADKHKERARQMVRRHLATELMPSVVAFFCKYNDDSRVVVGVSFADQALTLADDLIEKTGGHNE